MNEESFEKPSISRALDYRQLSKPLQHSPNLEFQNKNTTKFKT